MDIVLKNVRIPDFRKLRFESVNVGLSGNLISRVSSDSIKGKKVIDCKNAILSPGLIDCHCHIESSYLIPSLFGDAVSKFGTLFVVADCHEISNVAGKKGLKFFFSNSVFSGCNIYFAVPSCVPASDFATSGGRLDEEDIKELLEDEKVVALGELMNIPAVLNREEKILRIIKKAKMLGKRVNGHAPGLTGENLKAYFSVGIEDDHESETYHELLEKISVGARVFIREGSAEHTEQKAYKIIQEYGNQVMFCTDDKTINHILETGHINYHLRKAVKSGINPVLALKCGSYNGLNYYGLSKYAEVKEGNYAHLVLFNNEKDFNPEFVIVNGEIKDTAFVSGNIPDFLLNSFKVDLIEQLPEIEEKIKHIAIKVNNGSLITDAVEVSKDLPEYNPENDLLKIVVIERYGKGNRFAARIKGFGIKNGALASSLAHDCHNVLAVGSSDSYIKKVVNKVIENHGGLAVYDGEEVYFVPLPVGGIVSNENPVKLAKEIENLKIKAKKVSPALSDPLATLSFMALEVIPHLKITDRGLFDVDKFEYV